MSLLTHLGSMSSFGLRETGLYIQVKGNQSAVESIQSRVERMVEAPIARKVLGTLLGRLRD